jgi:hypothetical protein
VNLQACFIESRAFLVKKFAILLKIRDMKKVYMNLRNSIFIAGMFLTALSSTAQDSRGGACYFGNYAESFTDPSSISQNFLLAFPYTVFSPMAITHLGMRGNNTGSGVQLALYSNNSQNAPGTLLGYTALHTVGDGDMFLPISPVEVNAGTYWIAMIFENFGNHVNIQSGTPNNVYYISLAYGIGVPNTFSNASSYPGQDFLLWATATEISEVNINSCGPYIYNGQTISSTQTIVTETNDNGCLSITTANITIFPALDITVAQADGTLTANQVGAAYQWVDCDNNNAPIDGATSQSYTPTVSGSYAVQLTTVDCLELSECIDVTVSGSGVGIENQTAQFVHVYPNPANNVLHVELKDFAKIQIVTVSGQVILDLEAAQTHHVDLSSLSQGVYFVRANNETLRFVKL